MAVSDGGRLTVTLSAEDGGLRRVTAGSQHSRSRSSPGRVGMEEDEEMAAS